MGEHTIIEHQVAFEFVPDYPPAKLFCELWRRPTFQLLTFIPKHDDLDELLADVAEDWSEDPPADTLPGVAFADIIQGVHCRFPLTDPRPIASFRMCGEPVKSPGATYCVPCHKRTHSKKPTWVDSELWR